MRFDWRKVLISGGIALGLFLLVFLAVYLGQGLARAGAGEGPAYEGWWHAYDILSNGCFAGGAVLLGFPALLWVGRTGTFDVFSYSFYRLAESFRKSGEKRYQTAADYHLEKMERRSRNKPALWPYFALGAIALVLAIVFSSLA